MSWSRHFDRIAIALSTICIVHCLAVPLIVAVLPIAAFGFGGGHFHALMLWVVVPTSALGFVLGWRVHRRRRIVALGAAAVIALAAVSIYAHGVWPLLAEAGASVAASLALASAHWMNFREVKRLHRHGE